jgi:hypothetical protein
VSGAGVGVWAARARASGYLEARGIYFTCFAECPRFGTRQSFYFYFLKIALPSAGDLALGKAFYFFKKMLCRAPAIRHSAKFLFFFKLLCRVPTIWHSVKTFIFY